MHSEIPPYVYVIFTAVTSAGVLLQALVLFAMFLGLRKTQKKVEALVDDARVHLLPTIAESRTLLEELTPKIKVIASNLVDTTQVLRQEAKNVGVVIDDVMGRTRDQAARVDEMMTGTLNGVDHAASTVQHGVIASLRQITAVVNGLRAGFDSLKRKPRPTANGADEDLFV